MSKELLMVIDSVANEKSVSQDLLFDAMEEALAVATKKRYEQDIDVRVTIDRKTGDYQTFRRWQVVDEDHDVTNYAAEFFVDVAQEKGYDVQVGDIIEEEIPSIEFGRIAATTAKQIIIQKVRAAEKQRMIENYANKIGQIVYGQVKRATYDFVILDLGEEAEGILYKKELIPGERYRINDKVRAVIKDVDSEVKGCPILLSRTNNAMLAALLALEVPEIEEQLMEVKAIARDPGSRAKIAVKSNDQRLDPVGACVGMRGSRIQAITDELQGERIDIVLWDDEPAQFVIKAIAPAEVVSVILDEETQVMDVAVKDEHLSQAIGRNGQNVRLASELTGWEINVMSESDAEEKQSEETQRIANLFMQALDIEQDVAELLIEEGFSALEEVAYEDPEELLAIDGFDAEMTQELQARAKTALISQALSESKPADDLLSLEGMQEQWAYQLAEQGIKTLDDFAELATDEVTEMLPLQESQAADLIMKARAHWFEAES